MPSKNLVYFIAGLSIVAVVGYSAVRGHAPHSATEWLSPLGPAVTTAGVALWLFDARIWRFPGVRRIVGRSVLHGTWHGELASDWVNPETNETVPVDTDVFLVIRQRFWSLSARLLTKESTSYSIVADFKKAPDGLLELMYTYSNTPRPAVRYRSAMHFGTVLLGTPRGEGQYLEGRYFTDRRTSGELRFRHRFPEIVETHAAAEALVASAHAKASEPQ